MREYIIEIENGCEPQQEPDGTIIRYEDEITRCRDCRHYSPQDGTTWPECLWFGVAFRDDDDNGFCAWGKEKVEQ